MSGEDEAVAWLREAITEKKAAAEWLASGKGGAWTAVRNDDFDYTVCDGRDSALPKADSFADAWREDVANWIAANDPRSAIAQCDADLGILEKYENQDGYDLPEGVDDGRDPDERKRDEALKDALRDVVELVASGYKHREGYGKHWGSE